MEERESMGSGHLPDCSVTSPVFDAHLLTVDALATCALRGKRRTEAS
jgi:hypothetical protein